MLHHHLFKNRAICTTAAMIAMFVISDLAHGGAILFVDDDAPQGGDGTTWDTAYRFLQDALADASGGGVTEIHVGQGTYKPDRDEANPKGTGDREATFQLINNVALMGGYAGIGAKDPDARDIELFETILSGDLLGDDGTDFENNDENSFHVATASNTDESTSLDGFVVTSGNACCLGEQSDPRRFGGGVFSQGGFSIIRGCKFLNNSALSGGGIFDENGGLSVMDCILINNRAQQQQTFTASGGGILSHASNGIIHGCTFMANDARFNGGAIYSYSGQLTVHDCVFLANTASGSGAIGSSGDLLCSIESCTFIGNIASGENQQGDHLGGALFLNFTEAVIVDCQFLNNSAEDFGGAIASAEAYPFSLIDCSFSQNVAGRGGGAVYAGSGDEPSTWLRCSFDGNSAGEEGGAVLLAFHTVVLKNCAFSSNSAQVGGGIRDFGPSTIMGCTFDTNSATGSGGGIKGASGGGSGTMVTNSTFVGNIASDSGGGVDVFYMISNCTFIDNSATSGGGASGSGTVDNCILWENSPDQVLDADSVSYSDVQGGWPGIGNIQADPRFVDPDKGDFRLMPGSPCIDAGNNWGVPTDANDCDEDGILCELFPVDLDGNPRFNADENDFDPGCGVPVVVDMGAYEYQFDPAESVVFADLNADGAVGVKDFLLLLGAWGPCAKGCCLADLDINGNVGVSDFLALLGNWGLCP